MTTATTASSSIDTAQKPSRGLHIGLWVAQVLLALGFGMAGFMKATTPVEELAKQIPWVATSGVGLVRFIGVSELLGAIGLVLPAATRIKPGLTALAGAALAFVMVLAAGYHVMKGEISSLPVNFFLGGLAAFVAWGRYKKAPIQPRG